jgi:hypothetical protein
VTIKLLTAESKAQAADIKKLLAEKEDLERDLHVASEHI